MKKKQKNILFLIACTPTPTQKHLEMYFPSLCVVLWMKRNAKKKRTIKRLDITLICHVYKTETIFLFFFLFIWKLEKMFNCNLFPIDGII